MSEWEPMEGYPKSFTEVILGKICREVEAEWGMGGLSDGIYADYAKEVAQRFHGWLPISIAPKDGTAILVATIYSGHGTGFMEPVRTQRHHYGEWTNIYTGNSIDWHPTHWQPLPKPPVDS